MKTFLFLVITVLASCTKDSTFSKATSTPSVVSVRFGPVYAGANMSIRFTVKLNIPDTSSVVKVNLNRVYGSTVWKVDNPKTGEYIMYDHIIDTYPTHPQQKFYQLEFVMTDGSIIQAERFHVY